jgi:hypothetical protein
MIHVGELQPKNMFLFLAAFDPKDEYGMNVYCGSFLDEGFDKHMKDVWGVEKFDVIVMNPPYQELKEGNKKSQSLWHLFVKKTITLLKKDKFLVAVHPSGWRNVDGFFKETQKLMLSKQLLILNMRNFKAGQDIFNAGIDFDYYSLQNSENLVPTKIIDQDDNIIFLNLTNLIFIPSKNIHKILSLLAKENEEKVYLLSDSKYHTQKIEFMNKEKADKFILPCVYTIGLKNNIKCWYSNVDKGHFGIPKLIFGNGASGVIIDSKGEFGLTQFAYGIVDSLENLEHIKTVLNNEYFISEIMGFKYSRGDKYNRKVIALFRKDFWKEFLD